MPANVDWNELLCGSCSQPIETEWRYCARCGSDFHPLSPQESGGTSEVEVCSEDVADDDQKHCFNTLCGAPIDELDLHCRLCGAKTDVFPEEMVFELKPVSTSRVTIHIEADEDDGSTHDNHSHS